MKFRILKVLAVLFISAFSLTACNSEPGISIVSVDLTSSDGLLDIYTITYSDGTTSNFVVTNGKDGEQGIQGIPGEDGHTPVITISEDGYWVIDGVETNTKAQGEKGEPGKDGTSLLTGNGSPSDDLGNNGDCYIDLSTWDFYVKTDEIWINAGNIKGEEGQEGTAGVDGTSVLTGEGEPLDSNGKDGDSYIDLTTWNYYVKENNGWILKGNIKGLDGSDGEDGNGIASIELTSSVGNVDTYTITYDNGETTTFTVTNGVDGEQGIQGIQGIPGEDGHTPVITIGENGNWYIDGKDTGVLAEGVQGPQGDPGEDGTDGLSAYEIYIKYHPEYGGSEEEWLEDLVNGNLREEYKVTFQTNGGSEIEPQYVKFGRLVTRPADDPTRTGYLFDGWYLGPELFPFNSYQVYDDITLLAHWKSMDINLKLDANGGQVEYNTKTVTYGVDYTLPTPTRANYTFDGWYFSGALCPISGTWDFSKDDITLKARWSGTKANISFASDSNISVDRTPVTVTYGEYFKLPVPTIKTGDVFIGWADSSDNLITDEEGYSTRPSFFKTNVTLKAVYYIPVTTPSQLLSLCRLEEGDKKLSMTYVLQNDLDFTGFGNESINYFVGKFDGNGYNIIGLENPLFNTIGSSDENSSKDISIENINLVDFSAESFVNQVLSCDSFTIDGVIIKSFVKDQNNYCKTYGIVKTIGDYASNRPTNFSMKNCHINDEFATIQSGLVDCLNYIKNVTINSCSVKSNTKRSAFISEDKLYKIYLPDLKLYRYESDIIKSKIDSMLKTTIDISYCSNYGDTTSLVNVITGNYLYYFKTSPGSNFDRIYSGNREFNISNCVNYGNIAESLIVDSFNYNIGYYNDVDDLNTYQKGTEFYDFNNLEASCKIEKVINFGKTKQFIALGSVDDVDFYQLFKLTSCFNAGATTNSSLTYVDNLSNNYQFIPLTGIEDSGAFSITNYSQITSDFFINTIGLDPEKWDLSYINIKDEYGLPKIIY